MTRDGAVAEQQEGERDDDAAEAHGKSDDRGLDAARARRGTARGVGISRRPPSTWICARNSSDKSSCAPVTTMRSPAANSAGGHDEVGVLLGRHVGGDLVAAEGVLVE